MSWWQRLKDRVKGWFHREPAPGRYESGSKFSIHGWVSTVPTVWPAREFLVYVPAGRSRWRRAPLLVLCHGCKQTPEEIAQGTRVEAFADRMGCVVLLPRQKDSANPWRCWNWFEHRTAGGHGEAAIVAAQIRSVRRAYRIDRKRVFVAGMSAGGALAAILGVRFPHLVTAVAVHSGIAAGAARSGMTALSVLRDGPERDVERFAEDARARATPHDLRVPLFAIHGDRDDVVRPVNAIALVRQYLRLNAHPAISAEAHGTWTLPKPDREQASLTPEGRTQVVRDWYRDGRLVARHVDVGGLGHAWSGGDAALEYNDAGAPDATALVGGFITDALSSRMANED
jgi:poly(hydroxyalkanoate) depolymerase family esterase